MPRPLAHSDHKKFVETEGWTKKGTASAEGKTGNHFCYSLRLNTGEILYTRVSHGSGSINDPSLVASILREQLHVSEQDFYRCVNDGVLPPRPAPENLEVPPEGLDAKLVRNLITKVGLSQSDVAALSKAEAVEKWNQYLSNQIKRAVRRSGVSHVA
ncbi:MAG: hypothetical protein WA614_05925 [Acidimicrobiales bacterium]|jgi:hypothetical protein